jgi:hypothetical protein
MDTLTVEILRPLFQAMVLMGIWPCDPCNAGRSGPSNPQPAGVPTPPRGRKLAAQRDASARSRCGPRLTMRAVRTPSKRWPSCTNQWPPMRQFLGSSRYPLLVSGQGGAVEWCCDGLVCLRVTWEFGS